MPAGALLCATHARIVAPLHDGHLITSLRRDILCFLAKGKSTRHSVLKHLRNFLSCEDVGRDSPASGPGQGGEVRCGSLTLWEVAEWDTVWHSDSPALWAAVERQRQAS